MNKTLVLALAAAGTLVCAGAARAGQVQWSVGINVPGIVLQGGPVYAQPVYSEPVPVYSRAPAYAAPLYAPAPYYAPAPVYYAPEPVYYPRHPQWRHHYRAVPVVVTPRYQPGWDRGWQPVVAPRFRDDRDDRDDRHDRRDRRD